MANPNSDDWSQLYNNQSFFTATTTTTATSSDSPATVSPESRRISKPARRRSRASRRTPTTLLNTDTGNFRAMVQQFTGGPSAVAFGSSSSGTSAFSLTSSDQTAGGSSVGYQYANFQNQAAHHELMTQQQQRSYLFPSSNHVSYPNTVVSNGFGAVEERDGGGGGSAPSSEMHSNTTSWLQ